VRRILMLAAFLLGIPFFSLLILGLPWLLGQMTLIHGLEYLQYPVLIGLYAAVLPFCFALYQALKLLINRNKACSELTAQALKNIKYCAVTVGVLYVIGMPVIFIEAQIDDAPGLVLFGLLIVLASLMSAYTANIYQKRCQR